MELLCPMKKSIFVICSEFFMPWKYFSWVVNFITSDFMDISWPFKCDFAVFQIFHSHERFFFPWVINHIISNLMEISWSSACVVWCMVSAISMRLRNGNAQKWPAAITSVKKSYEEPPAGITHIFIAAPLSHNLTTWWQVLRIVLTCINQGISPTWQGTVEFLCIESLSGDESKEV